MPDGMLTLDLIQEEDAALDHHGTCAEVAGGHPKPNYESSPQTAGAGETVTEKERPSQNGSLPKRRDGRQRESGTSLDRERSSSPPVPKKLPFAELNKCASEEILSRAGSAHSSALRKGSESPSRSAERERLGQVKELVALKLERTRQLLLEAAGPVGRKGQSRDTPGKPEHQAERLLTEALTNWNQAKQVLAEVEELRDLCQRPAGRHIEPALISCSQPPCRRSLM
ncbi:hypothetical protein scyTo_0026799 [Scyliorhinus torazame]|uniref:Pleckstrin homology domain-containing family O member 1 n=1 Tax=Scyliorhinus torazame TaxID=75743 RepID=A0A401QL78_SCYTO|nr:hypothetical protein [Scyliorhinus torazame]